jgi:hypothetical protein
MKLCFFLGTGTFGPSTSSGSSGSGGYYLQGGGIYEQPYTTKTPIHYGLAQPVDIPAYPNYLSGSSGTGLDYGQNSYGNGGQPSSFFGKVRASNYAHYV